MVESSTSAFEERPDIICQPESRKNRCHRTGELSCQVVLGHHKRHILGHAVRSPYLENVLHELRFGIKTFPGDRAGLEWIVLERNEGEIGEPVVLFQVGDKAAYP